MKNGSIVTCTKATELSSQAQVMAGWKSLLILSHAKTFVSPGIKIVIPKPIKEHCNVLYFLRVMIVKCLRLVVTTADMHSDEYDSDETSNKPRLNMKHGFIYHIRRNQIARWVQLQ